MNKLNVGQLAPDFSLYNTETNKVALGDFKGEALLIHFFPFAFTGVCTKQLCSARDSMGLYNSKKVKAVGISVDSLFVLQQFKNANSLPFDLLSDFNKDVSQRYGAYFDLFPAFEYRGVSKRASFLLDKEGKILYAEVLETPADLPNLGEINKIIESKF